MSDNGELREDLKLPDGDLGAQLKSEYDAGKELLVCSYYYCFCVLLIIAFNIIYKNNLHF